MKSTNNINSLGTNSDSLIVQREAIPDCTRLEKSIIRETQNLAQHESESLFDLANRHLVNTYKFFTNNVFRLQAIAATTVFVITAIIITSNQSFNSAMNPIEPIDQAVWEDLWLMQDELAFAEL